MTKVPLLGYAVVFFGICLLMAVVMLMGKYFVAQDNKAKAAKAAAAPAAAPAEAPAKPLAPGSAGELKMYDVEPKTAAMIMAIVAPHESSAYCCSSVYLDVLGTTI